jgi:hypothetical protein
VQRVAADKCSGKIRTVLVGEILLSERELRSDNSSR